jgi:iron-sulfur cluster assembly protein
MSKVVSITEKAIREVKESIKSNPNPKVGLRLGVKGGGCSGLSYVIDFDEPNDKDIVTTDLGFPLIMDPKSSLYLQGAVLDYSGGLADRGFKFSNPNAENTCGCGESFSL